MRRRQYQVVLLSVVTMLAFSGGQAAAELRCTSQSPPAERLICADDTLQRLDTRLNEVYANTAQHVPDRRALVREQRAWFKAKRDACATATCMQEVMNGRMRQLTEMQLRHQTIKTDEISDTEALESCKGIVRLAEQSRLSVLAVYGQSLDQDSPVANASAGPWSLSEKLSDELKEKVDGMAYAQEVYLLKPSHGPAIKFTQVGMLSTCRSERVFNVPLTLSGDDDGVDSVDDPDDRLRWLYSGSTEYPIYFNGRNFIITGSHTDPDSLSMISVVRPSGRIRPICLATARKTWREPAVARDQAVCTAVAEKKIDPVQWQEITQALPIGRAPETYRAEFERRYGEYANAVSVVRLDVDGDGSVERVARFEFNSGGGCGRTMTWLRVIADDNSRVVKHALSPLLEKIVDGSLNIYEFGGRRYIETIGNGLKDALVTIRNGSVETVCEFRTRWEFEVTLLTKK